MEIKMKTNRKLFTIFVMLLAISSQMVWLTQSDAATNNILQPIEWRSPWVHPPVKEFFAYNNFNPHETGFDIKVTKSEPGVCHYGIQVISDNYVKLDKGKYKVLLDVYSNADGAIFFNIQSDNARNPNFVIPGDKRWIISPENTNGDFAKLSYKFIVHKRSIGLLHFKIGELPAGTLLKVKNIRIEKLD